MIKMYVVNQTWEFMGPGTIFLDNNELASDRRKERHAAALRSNCISFISDDPAVIAAEQKAWAEKQFAEEADKALE